MFHSFVFAAQNREVIYYNFSGTRFGLTTYAGFRSLCRCNHSKEHLSNKNIGIQKNAKVEYHTVGMTPSEEHKQYSNLKKTLNLSSQKYLFMSLSVYKWKLDIPWVWRSLQKIRPIMVCICFSTRFPRFPVRPRIRSWRRSTWHVTQYAKMSWSVTHSLALSPRQK